MTKVTIKPASDAGRTIDTFQILVDAFRATSALDVPSANGFGYSNVEAEGIELFFSGQNFTADKSDPDNQKLTGGTVNSLSMRDFTNGFEELQLWEGFKGQLDAKELGDAILKLVANVNDTEWLDVFGAFDYVMGPSNGNVIFRGFGGDDTMFGGNGNDTFDDRFGGDNDKFNGGQGSDTALVGRGISTLNGAAGSDKLSFAQLAPNSSTGVTYSMVTGAYTTVPTVGASGTAVSFETVVGSASHDRLTGNDAANTINGGAGNDTIAGGNGNDTLGGSAGNDVLNGGNGLDRLTGGAGRDQMRGGAGGDIFDFNTPTESRNGAATLDIILDFAVGVDKIDLLTIDASTAAAGNQAFTFLGGGAFDGVAGRLRFEPAQGGDTLVIGDRNGDSVGDFHILLDGSKALTAGDFIL